MKQNNMKEQQELNSCNETMLASTFPITDTEREEVTKNFRGKYSTDIDEMSDDVANKRAEAIKKLLAHIWNDSLEFVLFLCRFKIAKVELPHRKGRQKQHITILLTTHTLTLIICSTQ